MRVLSLTVEDEIPSIDPALFVSLVRSASDKDLESGFAANREQILREVFAQMPEHFDPNRAEGVDAVIEWRILDRDDGGHDAFHLIISGGQCRLEHGSAERPSVTCEIAPVDFIRLVTGAASGPKLFLFGRLKVRGNVMLASRMQTFFEIPAAQAGDG